MGLDRRFAFVSFSIQALKAVTEELKVPSLKDVLDRARHWPTSAQEELVRAAMIIERNQDANFDLTADDWKIIDERIAGAAAGDIATDAEVETVFGKYRLA
jgi:hypothetical protein